ncbi:MAG: hypothetical protein ACJAT7_003549 [Psychromonas sp.]|jgi:hypothetical protein
MVDISSNHINLYVAERVTLDILDILDVGSLFKIKLLITASI